MKKKFIFIIIIFCIIQLAILVCGKMLISKDILQVEYGNNNLFFTYKYFENSYEDGSSIQINSFRNEDTGEYFLFLPQYLKEKRSKVLLHGIEAILVDEEYYGNDNNVKFLAEGRHKLVANNSYFVLNVMYGAKIPSVFINLNTESLQFVHESKKNVDNGLINVYDNSGKLNYRDKLLEIHGRGNSSWEYQLKKGYSITLGSKTSLVQGCVDDKWNLIGNGYDSTLIQNVMMYGVADSVGLKFSPKVQNIDLYLEGEYVGVYLLSTKVKIGENSVNINNLGKNIERLNLLPLDKYEKFGANVEKNGESKGYLIPNNPDDITGGYLIEKDHWERYEKELSGFITNRGANFVIHSPTYASIQSVEYIQNFIQEIEDAMNEKNGINIETGKHYSEYIDMDSFVKCYLMQEISKNMDMDLTSQFFYKPLGINEFLYAGPVWDFDYTFGMSDVMVDGTNLSDPEDLLAISYDDDGAAVFSFTCLYRHKSFRERVKHIYQEEVRGKMIKLMQEGMDYYVTEIRESAMMNQARWGIEKNYDIQINEIKNFMAARIAFLDEVWIGEEQ